MKKNTDLLFVIIQIIRFKNLYSGGLNIFLNVQFSLTFINLYVLYDSPSYSYFKIRIRNGHFFALIFYQEYCKHWPKGFGEICKLWRLSKPTTNKLKLRFVTQITHFVAFCSFFPCSLTVFHRGRQQKSGGRQ